MRLRFTLIEIQENIK